MTLLEKEMATTPIFLPEESHGQRNLPGYSPWGHKESDITNNNNKWPFRKSAGTTDPLCKGRNRHTALGCTPDYLFNVTEGAYITSFNYLINNSYRHFLAHFTEAKTGILARLNSLPKHRESDKLWAAILDLRPNWSSPSYHSFKPKWTVDFLASHIAFLAISFGRFPCDLNVLLWTSFSAGYESLG